jgi:hypothetical protein
MATKWEYCILTRQSQTLDSKWYVNRIFQHNPPQLPTEVTDPYFERYNAQFETMHAAKIYPLLPAILNMLGADGWELNDDINLGLGAEGLLFKRPLSPKPTAARKPAKKPARKR